MKVVTQGRGGYPSFCYGLKSSGFRQMRIHTWRTCIEAGSTRH
jgi:hypothetical protein